MSAKAELQGVVVSDQDAEERGRRGRAPRAARASTARLQKRTSTFLAHNENDEAKVGDKVAIAETRPMSRRKRWAGDARRLETAPPTRS